MQIRNRRQFVLVLLLVLLVSMILFDPFLRQSMFGPQIQGYPLVSWKQAFLEANDPEHAQSKQTSWLASLLQS